MNLDDLKNLDLKNLDLKDLAAAPLPVKLIGIVLICLAIIGAGYWFIIQGEVDEYGELQKKEAQLKDTFMQKKALAINLDAYKAQMDEMRQAFGTMLRQLPNSTEVPDLLIDITQAGLGRGLEFVLFKPLGERRIDFYAELPISLQVTGSYHELGEFISDLAALPRIVTIDNINITPVAGKQSMLSMGATAHTYRYTQDDAAAALQAKARGHK